MSLIEPGHDDALELIADHCLAARSVIAERGTPAMARLIDLLLFEVGRALAVEAGAPDFGRWGDRGLDREG